MFNSLQNSQKQIGMILIAMAFGIIVGIKSSQSFGTCVLMLAGYTWGFIAGVVSVYISRNEKLNTWVASKLFWRRKNV